MKLDPYGWMWDFPVTIYRRLNHFFTGHSGWISSPGRGKEIEGYEWCTYCGYYVEKK